MKVVIEKVPQGIKPTLVTGGGVKPRSIVLTQSGWAALASLVQAGFAAESFRFEYTGNG